MRFPKLALLLAVPALLSCGNFPGVWRDQRLPSGKMIQVTMCNLVWGDEHDDRQPDQDAFSLEFVSANPDADPAALDEEASEVFELIRATSETWGFDTAYVAGFRAVKRKGHYNLFVFKRGADGHWTSARTEMKVFVND